LTLTPGWAGAASVAYGLRAVSLNQHAWHVNQRPRLCVKLSAEKDVLYNGCGKQGKERVALKEENLIEKAQSGDVGAVAMLYEENFNRVYRYARARLRDQAEAEDITQQVFIKMMASLPGYRCTGAPFVAWLFRIAHNQVIDYYRRKSGEKSVPLDDFRTGTEIGEETVDPSVVAEKNIQINEVMALVERLPRAQKEVVNLRFTAGLSITETAGALKKSEGTVKALQFNAIASLRKMMRGGADGA
jgi:RNA polymerase sigma-70 factor (ECF subfamily)